MNGMNGIQANNNPLFFASLNNAMGQTQNFMGANANKLQQQIQNFAQMAGGLNSFSMGSVGPNSFSFMSGGTFGMGQGAGGFLNSPMGAAGGVGGMNAMPGAMAQMPNAMQNMGTGLNAMQNCMKGPQGQQPNIQQALGQVMEAVGTMAQLLQKVMGGGQGQQFPGAKPMAQNPAAAAGQGPCAGKFGAGAAGKLGAAAGAGARQVKRPGLQGLNKAAGAAKAQGAGAATGKDAEVLKHMNATSGKKWLVNHGQYKKCKDGSFEITKGNLAGYKAVPGGKGTFNIQNPKGQNVGEWKAPKGKDKVASPVAFDLNGDGKLSTTGATTAKNRAEGTELGRTVNFDIDGDGTKDKIEWMAGNGDGLLVDNSDGLAAQDMNGKRLYGDEGGRFGNGYEKLALRDADGDGKLRGEELRGLEMWVDNGDAKVDAGEMKSLEELGINEISVQKQDVANERGETLMQATASRADGSQILTEDVWFGKDNNQG